MARGVITSLPADAERGDVFARGRIDRVARCTALDSSRLGSVRRRPLQVLCPDAEAFSYPAKQRGLPSLLLGSALEAGCGSPPFIILWRATG